MSANYADHRQHRDESDIKRLERIGLAARDPRNFHLLFTTMGRLFRTTTDMDTRAAIAFALLMIENWTPATAQTQTDTFSDGLDAFEAFF